MSSYTIRGVSVNFPFPPYDVQRAYMEKVIECLEEKKNGLLESPTGTGKTLSLLCSSLAWLGIQKEQYEGVLKLRQQEYATLAQTKNEDDLLEAFTKFQTNKSKDNVPKIIYASRTHSQITQAIQELKRSGYGHMKAAVIGSRDQLCINTEVLKETTNAAKTAACKAKIQSKSCSYHLRLEKGRTNREFTEPPVLDIEDLVKIGTKNRCCPFFVSKDQVEHADIVFMPYNYLLDPKVRSSNNIELQNTIVILDEAHNVEKLCEDSASVQLRSSDVALAISDVTAAMKHLDDLEKAGGGIDFSDAAKDFSLDDLATLKEMLLRLEQEIDSIEVKNRAEGQTYSGDFIFELLGAAKFAADNQKVICKLVDSLVQFLTVIAESTAFGKKGFGLQKLNDLLTIVFADRDEDYHMRIMRCYRVHVEIEETQTKGSKEKDGWLSSKLTTTNVKSKVVSYWCFSPNFAMRQLLDKQTRCIILTSGTLAPMGPLISEMGIPVQVQLENPHIVDQSQVLVQVIGQGPDKETLISNFQNRSNPKYLQSLGRTILSFCPLVPDGLLVFFPSYPILETCQKAWQETGVWSQIQRIKPIFVEPRNKNAFVTTMSDYYEQIRAPGSKGAVFMAVCRGKVSEGLDFANENGRAVIITGLPFPPLKDPRVILKKRYLDENRTRENQLLSGDEWYVLEAARAVNQAIGRVIRHRHDYGAILLCDNRFSNPRQQAQLSRWIQGHLKALDMRNLTFGKHIGDVNRFFRNAEKTAVKVKTESHVITTSQCEDNKPSFDGLVKFTHRKTDMVDLPLSPGKPGGAPRTSVLDSYVSQDLKEEKATGDFLSRLGSSTSTIDFNSTSRNDPVFVAQYQDPNQSRKRKYKLIENADPPPTTAAATLPTRLPEDKCELIKVIKQNITKENYKRLLSALKSYTLATEVAELFSEMCIVFSEPGHKFMLRGMRRFVKDQHREAFDNYLTLNQI